MGIVPRPVSGPATADDGMPTPHADVSTCVGTIIYNDIEIDLLPGARNRLATLRWQTEDDP